MPPLRLTVSAGNAAGTEIEVEQEFLFGRHADGAGNLAGDTEISRRHALISRTPGGSYVIEDLGSMNGTFVNGKRIAQPEPLADGDRIEVGGTSLVAHLAPADAPTSAGAAGDAPPQVELRIEIDLEARRASIALADGSDQVDLVHDGDGWRLRR